MGLWGIYKRPAPGMCLGTDLSHSPRNLRPCLPQMVRPLAQLEDPEIWGGVESGTSMPSQPLGSWKTKRRCHLHGKVRVKQEMVYNQNTLQNTWPGEG